MKKLVTILLLSPLFTMAQPSAFENDSAMVKINVSIQARDAEYIGSFVTEGFYRSDYDEIFDELKRKMRIENPPKGNNVLAIDSISVKTWLNLMEHIRKDYIAIQNGVYSRIEAILRATNNAYMVRLLNLSNTQATAEYIHRRRIGRFTIRKSMN